MKQIFFKPFVLVCLLTVATLNVWASSGAETLIRNTTNKVLEKLKADSSQIHGLVDKVVLPHFDFERMSKLVLGKNWRRTTEDQQKRFAKEFRGLLVRTYSSALVEAAGKVRNINYSTQDKGGNPPKAKVSTQVYQKGKSTPIKVDYEMYYHGGKWKVYNITVGGVSLVTNYRNEFANDIRTKGIEGLINKIKNQNN
jgi:phospholipid transport system substrate-binding protein